MHLTKIKLAGFKSFVDPTLFHVPDRIVTVVGPNGCGKSNIIDAVRWVMGESAARYLRGDSMEDVIFNGSSARKPVGQASVELFFDNSEGRLSGPWSQYSEIAVRRQVDRGGQSTYFLNGTRCRRRDITDIFLGTGLGPRSYAIIEQGTISRVIESKPEELRVFLEEAAGISKYKERRRETENRIRHTLENLSRVNDICEELDRQLQHLHKQARNAERYKQLRAEERELKAQLLALRWQRLDQEVSQQQAQIAAQENRLHEAQAEQAAQTTDWTRRREQQQTLNDQLHQAEAEHYQLATTIAQLQQQIEHQAELKQAHVAELARTEQALHSAEQQQAQDLARLENAEQEALSTQAGLEHLQEAEQSSIEQLAAREQAWQAWQKEWEQYNRQAATAQQHAAVERARIEQLERSLLQAQRRLEKIEAERDDDELAELDQSLEQAQIDEQTCAERVTSRQLLLDEYSEQFQTLRLQQQ
ncbi:MAG: AAA family ATPase, partial [Candidatus Competibacteraceae bacterium]|nr:AAA family ATPase [Candidatus Competibacteraceae bacterium]